jgi:integrase
MADGKSDRDVGIIERPRGSDKWCARVVYQGRQYWRRAANKSHAHDLYHEMKTLIRKGEWPPKPRPRPSRFDDLLDDYRAAKERQGKAIMRTDIGYRRLRERFGGHRADSITSAEVEAWQSDLLASMSIASVNHHLQLLRAILLRAVTNRQLRREDVPPMKLENPNNQRVRYLNDQEERRLVAALPVWLRPLVTVAIHTGMRKGELLNLKWADIDFVSGTIHVREAKSGEGRRLPMNSVARAALLGVRDKRRARLRARVVNRNEASGYVFTAPAGGFLHDLNRYWYPALKLAGIEDLHFHDLRHSFATRYMMARGELYTLQILLGHKTAAMVQRYAHLSPQHLAAEVERLVVSGPKPWAAARGQSRRARAEAPATLSATH